MFCCNTEPFFSKLQSRTRLFWITSFRGSWAGIVGGRMRVRKGSGIEEEGCGWRSGSVSCTETGPGGNVFFPSCPSTPAAAANKEQDGEVIVLVGCCDFSGSFPAQSRSQRNNKPCSNRELFTIQPHRCACELDRVCHCGGSEQKATDSHHSRDNVTQHQCQTAGLQRHQAGQWGGQQPRRRKETCQQETRKEN